MPTGTWNSWAGSTIRSRSAAFGWSSARLRRSFTPSRRPPSRRASPPPIPDGEPADWSASSSAAERASRCPRPSSAGTSPAHATDVHGPQRAPSPSDTLPLDPNGKIDRARCPRSPEPRRPSGLQRSTDFAAPATPPSTLLTDIWSRRPRNATHRCDTTTSSSSAGTGCWPRRLSPGSHSARHRPARRSSSRRPSSRSLLGVRLGSHEAETRSLESEPGVARCCGRQCPAEDIDATADQPHSVAEVRGTDDQLR